MRGCDPFVRKVDASLDQTQADGPAAHQDGREDQTDDESFGFDGGPVLPARDAEGSVSERSSTARVAPNVFVI